MKLDTSTPEGRIFWAAIALALAALVAVGAWRGPLAAIGVLIGAVFAILNYVWLVAGANAFVAAAAGAEIAAPSAAPGRGYGDPDMARAEAGRTAQPGGAPRQAMYRGVVLFFVRFALLAACVSAILISRLVPLLPVLGGLFVVPAAAMVEGVRMLTFPRISAKN